MELIRSAAAQLRRMRRKSLGPVLRPAKQAGLSHIVTGIKPWEVAVPEVVGQAHLPAANCLQVALHWALPPPHRFEA